MEHERARALLKAKRARVQELLSSMASTEVDDLRGTEEPRDAGDGGERLTAQGTDALVADDLLQRLAMIDRAERRLETGTYGHSIRSGSPIPDDRLEADPAAELTVQEARAKEAEGP